MGLMMVNALETRRNKGNNKKFERMRQFVFTRLFMLLDREFHLEIYYRRMVSSCMEILIDKQKYSRQNESFSIIYKL